MSYLNILHTSGLDVKFGHFSSSPGKLRVFHIFAQWAPGTQNKKMYKYLCYQLKVTLFSLLTSKRILELCIYM